MAKKLPKMPIYGIKRRKISLSGHSDYYGTLPIDLVMCFLGATDPGANRSQRITFDLSSLSSSSSATKITNTARPRQE